MDWIELEMDSISLIGAFSFRRLAEEADVAVEFSLKTPLILLALFKD